MGAFHLSFPLTDQISPPPTGSWPFVFTLSHTWCMEAVTHILLHQPQCQTQINSKTDSSSVFFNSSSELCNSLLFWAPPHPPLKCIRREGVDWLPICIGYNTTEADGNKFVRIQLQWLRLLVVCVSIRVVPRQPLVLGPQLFTAPLLVIVWTPKPAVDSGTALADPIHTPLKWAFFGHWFSGHLVPYMANSNGNITSMTKEPVWSLCRRCRGSKQPQPVMDHWYISHDFKTIIYHVCSLFWDICLLFVFHVWMLEFIRR